MNPTKCTVNNLHLQAQGQAWLELLAKSRGYLATSRALIQVSTEMPSKIRAYGHWLKLELSFFMEGAPMIKIKRKMSQHGM